MTVTSIVTTPEAYAVNLSLEMQKPTEDFAALYQVILTGEVPEARFSFALFKKDRRIHADGKSPLNNN